MQITSIIVLGFNKWNYSKSCLEHLFRQPTETTEIIFFDNGSTDETQAEASKIDHKGFKYIRRDTNGGFAVGCNEAYSHSTGDNILFLNNDIRIKDDKWLSILTDAVEDNTLVGVNAGFVDPKKNFAFQYETKDTSKPINYISAWCLMMNRYTCERLNSPRNGKPQIFSEEFGLAFFEDTDLSFRSHRLGMKFKLVDIPVVHFGHITANTLNTNKLYSEARQIFIKKSLS